MSVPRSTLIFDLQTIFSISSMPIMLDGTIHYMHTYYMLKHSWQWLGLDRCWGYSSVPQNLPASALRLPGHSHALTDPAGQRTLWTNGQWIYIYIYDVSYIHIYIIIYIPISGFEPPPPGGRFGASVCTTPRNKSCKGAPGGVPRWKFLCSRAPFWLASWDSESSAVRLATMASFSVRWNLYALYCSIKSPGFALSRFTSLTSSGIQDLGMTFSDLLQQLCLKFKALSVML